MARKWSVFSGVYLTQSLYYIRRVKQFAYLWHCNPFETQRVMRAGQSGWSTFVPTFNFLLPLRTTGIESEGGIDPMSERLSAAASGTIRLGKDSTVNRLGFGAMRITGTGIWGPPKDRGEAIRVLRRAVELQVNLVDTADSYGPDVSEQLIAEALFPYPKGLTIATKGGWRRPGPGQWTHDASPEHLREAVNGSLKKLRLDRIDLYQLHIPDPVIPFEQSVETLAALREEGKIRLIGLSNVTREHIERAQKITPIVSVQNRYSFADREWDYVVDYCEKNGIAFIPWAPIRNTKDGGDAVERIAKAHNATPRQISLAWLLQRSPMMLPIPGTSSVAHLEENIAAAGVRLTQAEYDELSRVPVKVLAARPA